MSNIKDAYPLILNKVASPQYATPTLRRPRLINWLNRSSDCRAMVLAAAPGYGKTTLLWQWEREVDFPIYWYKLDDSDRDWTLHISYLIETIDKRHEDFGRRAHSMLQQLGGPGSSRPSVAAYLLAEMHERLTEPCTFIVDDWHYVGGATEVRGLWNQILRDAPATCRFIFAARGKPQLQFARFKAHAGYAELKADALRFTETEIAELFRDVYDDPLDASELDELERRTEGWAASLQLVGVSLRERKEASARRSFIESISGATESDLFAFLAEEVLDQLPEETRNFLLATSIAKQITPEIAERLTGAHDGRRALTDLEHRGLFTSRLDDTRYRYHTLFRSFLERRLRAERSAAEVVGLHIHAASYFETTELWPEAIHHYLEAHLQRQAARLLAKHGEEVVSSGRLGLVDEWLLGLPPEAIKQNARLSLLFGEACGIRGEWQDALTALERARSYFARKGDRRLEALACLKLSSVYSNYGDADSAVKAAEDGLLLVPTDAVSTRLRLEGNLAITKTWFTEPLDTVARECQRIATEASTLGLEHFGAIGHHNAGEVQLRMGRIDEAIVNLERAARFWSETPTNPFAHSAELAMALVVAGQVDKAAAIASDSIRRTAPWPRPKAHALQGWASVLAAQGRVAEAIGVLRSATADPTVLGAGSAPLFSDLMEYLYLAGQTADIADARRCLESGPPIDPRYGAELSPSLSIADHVTQSCRGGCQRRLSELDAAQRRGARFVALTGRVKIGALAFSHRAIRPKREAWKALAEAFSAGFIGPLRLWVRLYAPHAHLALELGDGARLLSHLAAVDPDGWRPVLINLLPTTTGKDRASLLATTAQYANRMTVQALVAIDGTDVADVRRQLLQAQAARMYLRTFGGISLRRSNWQGPEINIEKRRVRALLAVLAAHAHTVLTRDMATDILWPDADGDSAVNNLNQTVFQLRRYLDPEYRQGESPEYVISNAEQVALSEDLVHTDLQELRRLPARLANPNWQQRQEAATRAIALVKGEFLADLRYEAWASRLQVGVHNEVRARLLPIALKSNVSFEPQIATDAASALITMDPFDETATLALADCLATSGRRIAARELLIRYAEQLRIEFDEEPSPLIAEAAARLRSGNQS